MLLPTQIEEVMQDPRKGLQTSADVTKDLADHMIFWVNHILF